MSRSLDSLDVPLVDTTDLIDAHGVAALLGLTHSNSVSTYQRRYSDMPRPAIDFGSGKCKLWRRSEIEAWAHSTGRVLGSNGN